MLLYWLTRDIHAWLLKWVLIATPKEQAIVPCKHFAFNDGVNHKIHSVIVMLVNSNENSNNIVSILSHTQHRLSRDNWLQVFHQYASNWN